jgi:hypothetical protein
VVAAPVVAEPGGAAPDGADPDGADPDGAESTVQNLDSISNILTNLGLPTSLDDKGTRLTKFYGATYLLDAIGNKLGIIDDLRKCFPDIWLQILSIAYFLIIEYDSPLYMFEEWEYLHKHPFGNNISSQDSSRLLASITECSVQQFFKLQSKRRIENEYWAYDISDFSSYSTKIPQVQPGKNKRNTMLDQFNLACLYGEESGLPFYYRLISGAVPDVMTLKTLLDGLYEPGFQNIKLVMDRGFYSADNISELLQKNIDFLVGAKKEANIIKQGIDRVRGDIRVFPNYISEMDAYGRAIPIEWNAVRSCSKVKGQDSNKHNLFMHVYFNPSSALDEEIALNKRLDTCQNELENGKWVKGNVNMYKRFFGLTKKPESRFDIVQNVNEMKRALVYSGFFSLLSTTEKDPKIALKVYRAKDIVEKGFLTVKERMNLDRLLTSSLESLEGKLFIMFIGMILVSYINKKMHDNELYKDYSMKKLFKCLDRIECHKKPGLEMRVLEVLGEQRNLYLKLEIDPLLSGQTEPILINNHNILKS